ncbi:MAG: hypothetical protein IT292_04285 [Deltaproteobacteria bacterium]|nr:hypothetical protein [Deltaproteobacteria bacterium]
MLYEYFQPHFIPRLRYVPLRLQEIGELEQAAKELRKAVKRAAVRSEASVAGKIKKQDFEELLQALDFTCNKLGDLFQLHPGDSDETLNRLVEERHKLSGWELWVRLVSQRLKYKTVHVEQKNIQNQGENNAN